MLTSGILLLFLTPITVFAIMLRSAERVNRFRPAQQEIAIAENNGNPVETQENEIKWSATTNASGNRVAEKEVQVGEMSNPNGDYMRVCIVPTWFDASGCAVSGVQDVTDVLGKSKIEGNALLFQAADNSTKITVHLDEEWASAWNTKQMDGMWYFESKKPIKSGMKENLITLVEISDDLLQDAEAQNLFLRVDVLADAIQTSGNAKNDRWGNS